MPVSRLAFVCVDAPRADVIVQSPDETEVFFRDRHTVISEYMPVGPIVTIVLPEPGERVERRSAARGGA